MVEVDCNELQQKIWDDGILLDRVAIMGICAAVNTNKNMMFAGVPGTAKTMTAQALAKSLFGGSHENKFNNKFHRITATPGITRQEFFGDWNYQKQFLEVQASCSNKVCNANQVEHVYREENFIDGPAISAIKTEGVLFIDEANRGGEDFQNMVLEVAEEKQVTVPMLGTLKSKVKGLPLTIVTYNEQDIGTEPFSDAFNRRFMRIKFKTPPKTDADKILERKHGKDYHKDFEKILKRVI